MSEKCTFSFNTDFCCVACITVLHAVRSSFSSALSRKGELYDFNYIKTDVSKKYG